MDLDNGVEETVYKYDLDLTDLEQDTLVEYAINNIPVEERKRLFIEWAVLDLLKSYIEDVKAENNS